MKYVVLLVLVLCAFMYLSREKPVLLPLITIQGLTPVTDVQLADTLDKDLLFLIHIDQLTCKTCVNKHIETFAGWYAKHQETIGFILTVDDPDFSYTRHLRRINGFNCPILHENPKGILGEGFFVSIYDMATQERIDHMALDVNSDLEKFKIHLK